MLANNYLDQYNFTWSRIWRRETEKFTVMYDTMGSMIGESAVLLQYFSTNNFDWEIPHRGLYFAIIQRGRRVHKNMADSPHVVAMFVTPKLRNCVWDGYLSFNHMGSNLRFEVSITFNTVGRTPIANLNLNSTSRNV